jgi:hypothetical protein
MCICETKDFDLKNKDNEFQRVAQKYIMLNFFSVVLAPNEWRVKYIYGCSN